jgi:Zn-dependent M28 family amino/carboxypeptidase
VAPSIGVGLRHDVKPDRWTDPEPPLTRFWVSWETANQLVAAGARVARLRLKSHRRTSTARNVMATQVGGRKPDEVVLIGAHYDTQPGVPGAADNASGVGALLELARVCAARDSHRTFRFVAWDAEETGLAGSVHYIRAMSSAPTPEPAPTPGPGPAPGPAPTPGPAVGSRAAAAVPTELDRHLLYVNLDVLGVRLGRNACYVLGPAGLESAVRAAARRSGSPWAVLQDLGGSDSETFAWCGVPAVHFTREGPASSLEHTTGDVLALLDPGQLESAGRLITDFLRMAASEAETWPFERVIPEATRTKVRKAMERMGWAPEASPSAHQDGTEATT